jgi:RimJ/RimL family protein N-acetyltransferase
LCGLVNRPTLDDVDLGYAVYSAFRRKGIAREAAEATLQYAAQQLKLTSLLAITSPDNRASIRLLESLGFRFLGCERIGTDGNRSNIYRIECAERIKD